MSRWSMRPVLMCTTRVAATALAAGLLSTQAQAQFAWLTPPTPTTTVVQVPVGNGLLTVMESGYAGGLYPFDTDGDKVPDRTLTVAVRVISRVLFDESTYTYEWELVNAGQGAVPAFVA